MIATTRGMITRTARTVGTITATIILRIATTRGMITRTRRIANEEHGIAHSTIQLETSVRGCTSEDHHVDHLLERQMARKKKRLAFFGHHH